MKQASVYIVDEVYATVQGLSVGDMDELYNRHAIHAKGYRHNPKFKLGIWDGRIAFFKKPLGKTYVKLLPEIIDYLRMRDYDITLTDNRKSVDLVCKPVTKDYLKDMGYDIELGEHQVRGINALIGEAGGIFEGGTGAGKTIMTAALAHTYEQEHGFRTITIVPTSDLIDQTYNEMVEYGVDVGRYGGNTKDIEHHHLVSTWQSLNNNKGIIGQFEVVIVDECHGVRGQILQELMNDHAKKAVVRMGLTGTIPEDEIDQMHVRVTLGDVVEKVEASELIASGWLARLKLYSYELVEDLRAEYHEFCNDNPEQAADLTYNKFREKYLPDYQSEKKFIQKREERLDFLAKLISKPTKNTLVLVPNVEFGKKITKRIPGAIFFYGQDSKAVRAQIYDSYKDNDDIVAITTFSLASTGLNIKRVFNLFLIDAGKSYVQVIQSIGRGLRRAHDKYTVRVYDVYSDLKFSKRHGANRKKHYKNRNYPFKTDKIDYLGWFQGEND
jgi:superfamily II DNA or RNA helicase